MCAHQSPTDIRFIMLSAGMMGRAGKALFRRWHGRKMLFRTKYSNVLCTGKYWGQTHCHNGRLARLGVSARSTASAEVELEGSHHGTDEDNVLMPLTLDARPWYCSMMHRHCWAGREAVSSEQPRSPSRRGGNSFNSHHLKLNRIRPGIVRGPITALSTRIEGAVLNGWYDVIDRPTAVRQVDARIFYALWNLGFGWRVRCAHQHGP